MVRDWPDTRHVYYGTSAERAAFPADGEAPGAVFFDYDDNIPYYWDGASWRPLIGAGVLPLFMYDDASADVAGYRLISETHSAAAESTVTAAALGAGATLIDEWVTPAGSPGLHFLEDGVYHWHVHAEKSAGTKAAAIYAEIYQRTDPGGVETLLVTTQTSPALTGAELEYDLETFAAEFDVDLTDRIVLKVYAFVSGVGSDPTVVLHMEGDTFSRLEIPVPGGAVAGGGWKLGNAYVLSSSGDGDYATVALAFAAMVAGDVLLVDEGTYTCDNQTVPDGCAVVGVSQLNCVFTSAANAVTLNIGSDCYVAELSVTNTTGGGADNKAVNVPLASTGSKLFNVLALESSAFAGHGIYVDGEVTLNNCDTDSASGIALSVTANGDVTVMGGDYDGNTSPLTVTAGGAARLYAVPIVRGTPTGVWEGAYITNSGIVMGDASMLDMDDLAGAPAGPAANRWRLWFEGDGLHILDSAASEYIFPGGVDPTGHTHSKLVASDGAPDPALSASAAGALSVAAGLTLTFASGGATVGEFSTDGTLAGNSDTALPTEKAVKTYIDTWSAQHYLAELLMLPGLAGVWSMASVQRSTGNVYDSSGQGRTLTYTGNPLFKILNPTTYAVPYIDFDGTGDYLTRSDETDLDILGTESWAGTPGLSMCVWVQFDNNNTLYYHMSKYGTAGTLGYTLRRNADGTVSMIVSSDGTATTATTTVGTTGTGWVFTAGRFVPGTSVDVYLGIGGSVEKVANTTSVPAAIFNNAIAFNLGARNNGTNPMAGNLTMAVLAANAWDDAVFTRLFNHGRVLFGV